jgi:riboflavin kinase/FMN adenylyltransferase
MIEVNIFDFDREIYNLSLKVFVKKFLRTEKKFASLDELKKQLALDKIQANLEI